MYRSRIQYYKMFIELCEYYSVETQSIFMAPVKRFQSHNVA